MTADARRTVRQVTLVVETQGLSQAEHDRRVFWAESNLLNANNKMDAGFVAVIVTNTESKDTRFSGAGKPTPETSDLIEELRAS